MLMKEDALFLTSREALILTSRYWPIGNQEPRLLIEIADILGVSRERVRQIEKEIIKGIHEHAANDPFYANVIGNGSECRSSLEQEKEASYQESRFYV